MVPCGNFLLMSVKGDRNFSILLQFNNIIAIAFMHLCQLRLQGFALFVKTFRGGHFRERGGKEGVESRMTVRMRETRKRVQVC